MKYNNTYILFNLYIVYIEKPGLPGKKNKTEFHCFEFL